MTRPTLSQEFELDTNRALRMVAQIRSRDRQPVRFAPLDQRTIAEFGHQPSEKLGDDGFRSVW
jgi:hypothetical protein